MKKVIVDLEETLKYKREIEFLMPEDMDEDEFQELLKFAERNEKTIEDFVHNLRSHGINCPNGYDDSLDCPNYMEVEVWDFEIEDDEKSSETASV